MSASEERGKARGGEPGGPARRGSVLERLSRYGAQVLPSAFQRGPPEEVDGSSAPTGLEGPPLTPAMRKTNLGELLPSHRGSSGVLSAHSTHVTPHGRDADWEHAWMLSAVDGDYDSILEFVSHDPLLLSRKDVISGYTVLHWLAKRGQDETLLQLVHYARRAGIPVDVDVRGSGGVTPLHVASMQRHYAVVKALVGAFGASADLMDHSGRRAWQYLPGDAPPDMQELLGMWDDEHRRACAQNVNNSSSGGGAGSGSGSGSTGVTVQDKPGTSGVNPADGANAAGGWMIGSLRKMLPWVLGNKHR